MRKYTINQKAKGFEVITPENKIIKNHLEQNYPVLPEEVAKLLCKDLNEIIAKNEKVDYEGDDEARESFIYCVISTLMGIDSKVKYRPIDFRMAIQWDRAFRLMPDPIQGASEVGAINDLVNFLDGDWVDLPLSYGESIDDMEIAEDEKVPENIIAKLEKVYEQLNNAEQAALHILFAYMESFSISMPLLWLNGKVSDHALAKANLVFNSENEDGDYENDEKEYMAFFEKRLKCLKDYLNTTKV